MEIEVYSVDDLRKELDNKEFWFQNVAPITKHRAQLIINNPRSESGDAVLFIAREGEEIAGYRVMFPDWIWLSQGPAKVGWGSSFWVSEKYRGKGVGRLLFEKSYEIWKGRVGSLNQSTDAARLYTGNPNFYLFNETVGYQFILRMNTAFWVNKRLRLARPFAWLLRLLDAPLNSFIGLLQNRWTSGKTTLQHLNLEYCREVSDPESIQFVVTTNKNSLSRKGIEDLNAIVRYPTSLATPLKDVIGSRYYFATRAHRFEYFYLKVYDSTMKLMGLMLMNLDGGSLRLLYHFAESREATSALFDVFLFHAVKLRSEVIHSFDIDLNDHLLRKPRFPTLFNRNQVRRSYLSKDFGVHDAGTYKIYDGDGA